MIIGLTGTAKSGKDTVARILKNHLRPRVHLIQISGQLKAFCRETFDWTEEHTDGRLKDTPDPDYPRPCVTCDGKGETRIYHSRICPTCFGTGVTYLTPRQAMQTLGDDWTTPLYPNLWAIKAGKTAKAVSARGEAAIITDCRFVRDLQAIVAVGGVVVQLHRENDGLIGETSRHRSEKEWGTPEFQALVTHHIYNYGTLVDLEVQVLTKLKIIPLAEPSDHQRDL